MFRVMLWSQWKWSRQALAFLCLLAFALPLVTLRAAADAGGIGRWEVLRLLSALQSYGMFYPLLAGLCGLLLAFTAWQSDRRGRHVYALALPIERWRYVLLRFGAGLVLLAGPVLLVWLGALVAVARITLPQGLHGYPTLLALRFALATVVSFACFFSVVAGSSRTAAWILGILGLVILLGMVVQALTGLNPVLWIIDRLMIWPGPLDIFTGRWMLIDV